MFRSDFVDKIQFILDNVDESEGHAQPSVVEASILKMLLLVYILDHLKEELSRPCLFRSVLPSALVFNSKDSKLKSSLEVARALSKCCLSGEGDIGRSLRSITKSDLRHVQYPLDTYDYKVSNMAVDIRDGVRLAKLVEIWSETEGLSQHLRWPALTRTQRAYNVSVALASLQAHGVDLHFTVHDPVTTEDIESGDREKTLFLIWQMINRWRLPQYIENITINKEVQFLRELARLRKHIFSAVKVKDLTRCYH
jgi:abnormal spindle-like microcephaly-associated protein